MQSHGELTDLTLRGRTPVSDIQRKCQQSSSSDRGHRSLRTMMKIIDFVNEMRSLNFNTRLHCSGTGSRANISPPQSLRIYDVHSSAEGVRFLPFLPFRQDSASCGDAEVTSPCPLHLSLWRAVRCDSMCRRVTALCLLLLLCASQAMATREQSGEGALEFKDILPSDPRTYDKMTPPREEGQPTIVYFHVTVMSLDSIDESSMTYAADIFFAQSWKDSRLRLPDNMTQLYRLLPVQWLKDIWRPDAFFKNAKAVTFQEMTIPNHYLWLYQDKTILYMVKLTLVLSCAMNFEVYPHDTQECTMKIESISHTTADLVFVWEPEVPLEVDKSIELPQLDLVRNVTGDCTQVYSTGNFTCLEVIFTFRRRLGYYLFHTYIPTCLIVIMSWISFWIRPEAVPARVTLGVTSLLTLATQHANSQKSLPPVSYIKAIDVFMSSCMVFVFLSLMEYALVNVVLGDVPEESRALCNKNKKKQFWPAKIDVTDFNRPPRWRPAT
ncbi:Neurotransmitter-gated ion-channel [Trinorchestia longiramus]|nr:Neurotransmitter-gated ion-channel [Trinorchestia longiramus]